MRAVDFFRKRPAAVYKIRWERGDGHFRETTASTGWGRFRWGRKREAVEIAERRHNEQYGEAARTRMNSVNGQQVRDPYGEYLERDRPDLWAENYTLVSVKRRSRRR